LHQTQQENLWFKLWQQRLQNFTINIQPNHIWITKIVLNIDQQLAYYESSRNLKEYKQEKYGTEKRPLAVVSAVILISSDTFLFSSSAKDTSFLICSRCASVCDTCQTNSVIHLEAKDHILNCTITNIYYKKEQINNSYIKNIWKHNNQENTFTSIRLGASIWYLLSLLISKSIKQCHANRCLTLILHFTIHMEKET
jgi:hypothetical protein